MPSTADQTGATSGWPPAVEQLPEFVGAAPGPVKPPGANGMPRGSAPRTSSRFRRSGTPSHCTEKLGASALRPRPGREEMSTSAAAAIRSRVHGPFFKRAKAASERRAYLCELHPGRSRCPLPRPSCLHLLGGGCVGAFALSRPARPPAWPSSRPWKASLNSGNSRLPSPASPQRRAGPRSPATWWAL